MSIVIIGTGMAGYTLAREIRKYDKAVELTLISADGGESYPKPALSNAFSQGKTPDQIATYDAAAMAETLNARILTHTRVTGADTSSKTLQTDTAGELGYDQLVLATGAQPIRLPFEGSGADDLRSVNDLDDYRTFRELIEPAQRVALIGPGLIGCEFANDLAGTGREVTVIGPDLFPISTLLPEAAGKALQAGLSGLGVQWQLGTVAQRIDRSDTGYQLTLANGETLQADVLLSAIGLKPDLTLASAMGLETARGIVTNTLLETSAADVYALGDCAEVDGQNLPYVMPLMTGARALAKTLTGTPTEVVYPIMPVIIKTPAHPIVVAPPARGAEGEWQIEQDESGVAAQFVSPEGKLLGFALTGAATAVKNELLKAM